MKLNSNYAILIFLFFLTLMSCNVKKKEKEAVWSDLPKVTKLDSLKKTDFVITLENIITENKNTIYAPAFLYAWDKLRDILKSPIMFDTSNSLNFKLLNKSITHQNSLQEGEYQSSAEIINGKIVARAFFNKTLPFETKLQALVEPIQFDSSKVIAFGMKDYNQDLLKNAEILYYKDDNNFILKLIPKDIQHEIILVKGLEKYTTLADAMQLSNNLIAEGIKEKTNTKLSWKYKITNDDIFAIPAIKFNVETNYSTIENQNFTSNNNPFTIETAYQRIGFILNENGAVVESEAVIATTGAAMQEPEVKHPKKMIFDKPFLIIVKRVDKANPYFVMNVNNAELMTKK